MGVTRLSLSVKSAITRAQSSGCENHDQKPGMSANEVTERLIAALKTQRYPSVW